jgi:ribosomal RNA-processing protein 8
MRHRNAIIADMGCGEARLSESIPNKTHSFDLVAPNSRVTACDIASVPLENSSVDIVVFCLSLMGTNICDFIKETSRILRVGGRVKIAEVRSRFQGEQDGKDGINKFIKYLKKVGFDLVEKDVTNVMFFMLEVVKSNRTVPAVDFSEYRVQPCLYKRR